MVFLVAALDVDPTKSLHQSCVSWRMFFTFCFLHDSLELLIFLLTVMVKADKVHSVGTKPSVHTSVSTYELEDFSKPLNQDTEGWITVKKQQREQQKESCHFFLEASN
jgi:hypothetical protein